MADLQIPGVPEVAQLDCLITSPLEVLGLHRPASAPEVFIASAKDTEDDSVLLTVEVTSSLKQPHLATSQQ